MPQNRWDLMFYITDRVKCINCVLMHYKYDILVMSKAILSEHVEFNPITMNLLMSRYILIYVIWKYFHFTIG